MSDTFFSGSMFMPQAWYWQADDGRVYSGFTQTVVANTFPDYVTWVDAGNTPSTWPRNLGNEQTDDELQAVLSAYGMFVNLKYYSADKRWRKEHGGMVATEGFPVRTDDRSQAKITGLYAAAKENQTVVTSYHAADGTVHQLDAAKMHQLNIDLLTHINNCFAVSADVLTQIEAGTITTRGQVDAAFDAPMTAARKNWMKQS